MDREDDDLAVALARHIGLAGGLPDEGEGILAAGDAALGRIAPPRPQVELGDGAAAGEVDQADAVVLVIDGEEPLSVRADRDPGGRRLRPHAEPVLMVERYRRRDLGEDAVLASIRMNEVVDATADVETGAVAVPGDADEGVGNRQDLLPAWRPGRDIVDEDVFIRCVGDTPSGAIEIAVEAAGEREQKPAVGARRQGDGLAGAKIGNDGQIRIQHGEIGARRSERPDRLAGRYERARDRRVARCAGASGKRTKRDQPDKGYRAGRQPRAKPHTDRRGITVRSAEQRRRARAAW